MLITFKNSQFIILFDMLYFLLDCLLTALKMLQKVGSSLCMRSFYLQGKRHKKIESKLNHKKTFKCRQASAEKVEMNLGVNVKTYGYVDYP